MCSGAGVSALHFKPTAQTGPPMFEFRSIHTLVTLPGYALSDMIGLRAERSEADPESALQIARELADTRAMLARAEADEHSAGIGRANQAVPRFDDATRPNAALAEEPTMAAEQLKEQAKRLAEPVGGFTLSTPTPAQKAQQGRLPRTSEAFWLSGLSFLAATVLSPTMAAALRAGPESIFYRLENGA